MKIILEHEDINTALVNYVASLGIDLSGKDIVVELTAGRKENGNSAAIEITTKKIEGKVTPLNKSLPEVEDEIYTEQKDEGVPVEATQEVDDDEKIFE